MSEQRQRKSVGGPRFWGAMVVAMLVGAGAVVSAQSALHVFNTGDTLAAADLNGNFSALDQRIATLEAAQARTAANVIMDNVTGGLGTTGKAASFTTAGGAVVLIVSGSGYSATAGASLDIAVQLDGTTIGHLKGYTNESGSHKTLPTRALLVPPPAAGTHNVTLLYGNATTTSDANDYYSVTAVELGH